MILVTAAAGKTGQAVIKALSHRGVRVKALVHNSNQANSAISQGAQETIAGDLLNGSTINKAMQGVEAVYFICSNVHPNEFEIGKALIEQALAQGVQQFVYHSVLFPQIETMPHHWQKLHVEETLIQSGLDFTILQPASYMQNVIPYWPQILSEATYRPPYSVESLFSPVDLENIAEAGSLVLTRPGHSATIYQLCGPEVLSSANMAAQMTITLGRQVAAISQPLAEWQASAKGLSSYAFDSLSKMFAYYDRHGLWGNSNNLELLLGRTPTTFAEFLERLPK